MFTCCCFSPLPPSCPLVALVSLLAEWGGWWRGGELQGKHTLSNPSPRARSDGPGGHEKPCGRTWLPGQWWQEGRRFFSPHVKWCSMFQEWGAGLGINVRASGWRREKGTMRLWNIQEAGGQPHRLPCWISKSVNVCECERCSDTVVEMPDRFRALQQVSLALC